MDERKLLEQLKHGDDEAFRMLVDRYQQLVLNCAFKFLRNRETAEDLTQEVFVEVFESIHSFRADAQLSSWMYRIAITKSLNHIKSLKRKKRFAVLVSLFGEDRIEEQVAAPDAEDPAVQLENKERADILHRALQELPEHQRVAFTLSKIKDLSYGEIAAIMETTVPAVESLLHRAKANLRTQLHAYYRHHHI